MNAIEFSLLFCKQTFRFWTHCTTHPKYRWKLSSWKENKWACWWIRPAFWRQFLAFRRNHEFVPAILGRRREQLQLRSKSATFLESFSNFCSRRSLWITSTIDYLIWTLSLKIVIKQFFEQLRAKGNWKQFSRLGLFYTITERNEYETPREEYYQLERMRNSCSFLWNREKALSFKFEKTQFRFQFYLDSCHLASKEKHLKFNRALQIGSLNYFQKPQAMQFIIMKASKSVTEV